VKQPDCKNGFILDGFPRNTARPKPLDKLLTGMNMPLTVALAVDVEKGELMKRLTGPPHLQILPADVQYLFHAPKKEGVCDKCSGALFQRDDDKEETIKKRLDVYDTQTAPLVSYYSKKNIMKTSWSRFDQRHFQEGRGGARRKIVRQYVLYDLWDLYHSVNPTRRYAVMALVKPHGKKKKLMPLLLSGAALQKEQKKAAKLKQLKISSRETADLVMMGIGAFTPLTGFMTKRTGRVSATSTRWLTARSGRVPVTLSASPEFANSLKKNEEITLVDEESGTVMATMKVTEKYAMSKADKEHECKQIFRTVDVAATRACRRS